MSSHKSLPPSLSEQSYNLSKLNYLSKNIISISNIPENLFSKDILYQKKFLGQYGHINQMILLNNHKNEKNVIVQFDTVNQAALAILSLQNFKIDENIKLKATYFINKYCYYFLNNKDCPNLNCLFLHNIKVNNYLLLDLQNNKSIDSYKFALDVLNIPKPIFDVIYMKLIGENYYEQHKKFPKMSMKKLKNKEFICSLYPLIKENFKFGRKDYYKKKSRKKCDNNQKKKSDNNYNIISKRDSFNSSDSNNEKISTSEESVEKLNDYVYLNYFKRKNSSRFDFVQKDKIDNNFSVKIPEFILDFLDKNLALYCIKNIINDNNDDSVIFNYSFNFNWKNIIKG